MKKSIALLSFVLFISFCAKSYAQAPKTEVVKIKTEFFCGEGKAKIEKEVGQYPGVSKVVADLETKLVTVTFDPNQMSKVRLNSIIEKAGFKTELTKEGTVIKSACDGKKETNCEKKPVKK